MIEQQLEADIKKALLGGDRQTATTLRGLKSAILYVKVAEGKRDSGLSEDETIRILQKESKKRQESAELYAQGGRPELQASELAEKKIIDAYLPVQLSVAEVTAVVEKVIAEVGANDVKSMGQVIGQVKTELGVAADGSMIARIVKEKLA